MNISIDVEETETGIIAKLAGEIDAYTAPTVRDELLPRAEQSEMKIVVDLSEVNYMDSTGLGIFVGLFKTLKEHNGELVLKGMSDRLKRLFDITGLADVMDVNTEVEGGV
ncbi:anti-sigma-B factor antagonist [Bacillus sp. J14TS2]|uniref:anti-sigma factor antagonist n=1 Tax=Bacillus sp. J14TS2 TaxID=2807188 RepID=UPI001B2EC1C8|nr:anti-sigma factor antagonist [Bacillus sp. J14TS2]GIN73600.1 anti-sigma-B factor antagonist [Bacillus sp. J14TS2]